MTVSLLVSLMPLVLGIFGTSLLCICLSRCTDRDRELSTAQADTIKGLSCAELEKLPKMSGKELTRGTECAVCLDEIEAEQLARVVPGCNHGFHLRCADAWLAKQSICPVCRAKLRRDDQQFLSSSSTEENPC